MRVVFPDKNHGPCKLPCSESHLLGAWQLSVWSYSHQASSFKPETLKKPCSKWQKENRISKKRCKLQTTPFFKWNSFFPLFILAGKRFLWLTTARQIAVSAWFVRFVEFAVEKTRITNNLETHHLCIDGWFILNSYLCLWFFHDFS